MHTSCYTIHYCLHANTVINLYWFFYMYYYDTGFEYISTCIFDMDKIPQTNSPIQWLTQTSNYPHTITL